MIKNPNDIVDEFVSDYRGIFGEGLLSAIMYGSAVTHEFKPGQSDINTAFVLSDNSILLLAQASQTTRKWRRKGAAVPLFMTKEYIASSLDTFPIEFLDMQSSYRILYGEDVLANIKIEKEHLRLQCERELKGITLHLRSAFIDVAGNSKQLRSLLLLSMRKLIPLFKALLVLHDLKMPNVKTEVVSSVEDLYGLGASVFSDIYHGHGKAKCGYAELVDRFAKAIDLIIRRVDGISEPS